MPPGPMFPARITIADATYTNTRTSPTDASAFITFEADGDIITNQALAGGSVDQGDWVVPKAAAGNKFQIRIHVTSGTFTSSPTLDTWLDMDTDRSCIKTRTNDALGTDTVSFTAEFRLKASQQVLRNTAGALSTAYTLNATVA